MQKYILYLVLFLFLNGSTYSTKNIASPKLSSENMLAILTNVSLDIDYANQKLINYVKKKKAPEKMVVVDPRKHKWSAYNSNGKLLHSGLATAGSSWCPDIGRPCKTKSGVFRVYSLGSSSCVSKKYPINRGGAPMPYCMYFNGGQGIHGSYQVVPANVSHGCVRVRVSDAKWLRFNFVTVGTKIVVKPY